MNKKLFELLKVKCKDMGLSEKAIEDMATSASDGITDQSADSEIEMRVNLATSFAKTTQSEATRWAQSAKTRAEEDAKKKTDEDLKKKADDEANGKKEEGNSGKDEPEWFKTYKEEQKKTMDALSAENQQFKSDKSKSERNSSIQATATKFKIPEWRMKGVVVPDDADVEKFFTDIKQDLVNQNLLPADGAAFQSNKEKATQDLAASLLNEVEAK
jgi:hypothetical protein